MNGLNVGFRAALICAVLVLSACRGGEGMGVVDADADSTDADSTDADSTDADNVMEDCESAMSCEAPPDSYCSDADTRIAFDSTGSCTDGRCSYKVTTIPCKNCPNCDACAGISCDSPPLPFCAKKTVLRGYEAEGRCEEGGCRYLSVDRTCLGTCENAHCTGAWQDLVFAGDSPYGRFGHTAVWTGTEMILWGGATSSIASSSDGAIFIPATSTWASISEENGPSARRAHTAVWTGKEMIVWGGSAISAGQAIGTGARYDPITDTWSAMSSENAPSPRFGHTAVWTGTEMIVWGGASSTTQSLSSGALYNPTTNTWADLSAANAPSPRREHTAVWTGKEMIIGGGSTLHGGGYVFNDGAILDPATDTWTLLPEDPSWQRFGHTAVWTGTEMIVWGGAGSSTSTYNSGARYDPVVQSWTPLADAPAPRRQMSAVWTGDSMMIWGGGQLIDSGMLATGTVFGFFQ